MKKCFSPQLCTSNPSEIGGTGFTVVSVSVLFVCLVRTHVSVYVVVCVQYLCKLRQFDRLFYDRQRSALPQQDGSGFCWNKRFDLEAPKRISVSNTVIN